MMEAFSPGEVIFFGEHSVVYGKNGLAAAISRGVTARGALTTEGKGVLRSKKFGELTCEIWDAKALSRAAESGQMQALDFIPQMMLDKYPQIRGFDIEIASDIPERSGLASSAAVTSALTALFSALVGEKLSTDDAVSWVYKGEIAIQKRGSVIGSACTVNGGFIGLLEGKWNALERPKQLPRIVIVDSGERCATSVTTQIIHDRLQRDAKGTEKLFDKMDAIARAGSDALYKGDWKEMGHCMHENQICLHSLGVSTEKIETLLRVIKPHVHGAKITGAGGGGCMVALPKDGADAALEKAALSAGGSVLPASLRMEGVEVRKAEACRR